MDQQIAETSLRTAQPKRAYVYVLLTVGLFIISFVVRFLLADYPKGIGVLPDEIRYLNLASSLLNHGELIERGGYASFQKILYPLSLFPAFMADDPQIRVRIVTVLNCLYVSSAVFPACLIARRLFKKLLPVAVCLLFAVIMPDMAYSMTFLSECVYLPLVLWLVWLSLVALAQKGRRALVASVVLGLLCYLTYLAKEVALGFVMAFTVMLVIRIVRAKRGARKFNSIVLLVFLAAFVVPFIVLKLTLFAGLSNSYNQSDPSILLDPFTIFFAFYAFVSDLVHFMVAFMFFPLVIPAFTWRRLTDDERNLYLFCLLSFVFILLAVVYTISIREDLGHVGVRPHVRYVAPLFLPLLFLTIKQLVRKDGAEIMRNAYRFSLVIALTCAMGISSLIFIGTGDYSQGFDYAELHIVRIVDESISDLPDLANADESEEEAAQHGGTLDINPAVWLLKLGFCAYLSFGLWAFISTKGKWPAIALLGFIALVMLGNNVGAYLYNSSVYRISDEDAEEFSDIERFIDGLDEGEQVLIVYDEGSSHFNNLMDVYVDNSRLNCSYITIKSFRELLGRDATQKELLIESDATMGDNVFKANGRTNDEHGEIAYIIMSSVANRSVLDSSSACAVTPEGYQNVVMYWIPSAGQVAYAPSTTVSSEQND